MVGSNWNRTRTRWSFVPTSVSALASSMSFFDCDFICSHAELPTRHDRDCSRRQLLGDPAVPVPRVAT